MRNAHELSDSRWDYDVKRLTDIIGTLTRRPLTDKVLGSPALKVFGAILLLIMAAGVVLWINSSRDGSRASNTSSSKNSPPSSSNKAQSNGAADDDDALAEPTPQGTPFVVDGIRYAPGAKDINSLKPEVARLAKRFVEVAKQQGIDVIITVTLRTFEEQDDLFASGRTKPGMIVTAARGEKATIIMGIRLMPPPLRMVNPIGMLPAPHGKSWAA